MSRKPSKLPLMVIGVLVLGVAGCELLVDFDRTKIDAGPLDGTVDVTNNDVTQDNNTQDVVNDVKNDVITPSDAGDAGDTGVTDASDGSVVDADDGAADADDGATADADDGAADDGADE
ncbi:MAG TPA: hypothetical protein VGH28_09140 [Polyangiaceae bacterium]